MQPVGALFEVNDPDESGIALDAVGLRSALLFSRHDGAIHLRELSATAIDLLRNNPDASLCLTGKAQSIAVIRRDLKDSGSAGRATRVKAYWDENRNGLD